ncbi:hypothetical protein BRADI_2g20480v3 [Brachypodium distachyon]|uniref:Leucine-rich repeat-containing N-terminal plant-type domain-containing protein n=1 Tax=Brachypodium distachyon TaxID=15368 RepID=A0A0Q3II43_BRADI|nr:hypothetical protein BRADI_2g20480v3 [Brachypodium distachyon]
MAATPIGTLPPLSAATTILVVVASFLASMEAMNPDVEALMALRNGLQDPNGELNSWDPDLVDACTWSRVVCDDLTRRVIRLELQMNNFHGAIPEEFGDLKNLISLDLFKNNISGPIPASLGKLKSLVFLRLDHNRLTGPVPNELLALDKLADANFSNNKLCGIIPTSGSFENMSPSIFANNSCLKWPGRMSGNGR